MFAGNRGPSWDPRAQTSSLVPRRWDHEGDWVLDPPGLTVSPRVLLVAWKMPRRSAVRCWCGAGGGPWGHQEEPQHQPPARGGSSSAPRVLGVAGRTGPSERLVLAASLASYSPGTCSRHAARLLRDPKTLKLGTNTHKSLAGALPYS